MKHQVNMLIACVFMAMFSGSSAVPADADAQATECPPMPDGICLPGRTLNATACGYWENPNGSREHPSGRSDSEMAVLGFTCMMTCGSIDQGHRANADPNGGPDCKSVYDYYNHNANCCVDVDAHAAFGACQAAALTTCPHITHFLNVSDSNTDMDRWGSDPEYAKHVIDEQQAWEHIKCVCNDCEEKLVQVWGLARHMCHLAKPCADGYTYCPSATDTPTHLQGGCDINGGCEMDDCCAGNGCADHQGEPPEFGYKDYYGCSYSFHNAASGPSGEGNGMSGSSGSSGPSGEDPGYAFGACTEAAYPKCPHITHFLNLNGTDTDRWGSDPEYAKHVLDEQQAWEQMKCICDHCERELEGVWPIADPMCVAARGGGGTDGCEGDGCCSSGTVFKDGKCVATYDGLLQACKDARGDWGWTCHADTDSCPK